jgi:hypothetical protein
MMKKQLLIALLCGIAVLFGIHWNFAVFRPEVVTVVTTKPTTPILPRIKPKTVQVITVVNGNLIAGKAYSPSFDF